MKIKIAKIFALFLCLPIVHAQDYDSTGAKRLWAPGTDVNTPIVIDVPGHGKFNDGAVVSQFSLETYNSGSTGRSVSGICVASSKTTSDTIIRGRGNSKEKVCPAGTMAYILNSWSYCTSDGGGG